MNKNTGVTTQEGAPDAEKEAAGTANARQSGTVIRVLTAPSRLIRKLYDWTISWSKTANAPYALFLVAFIESSVFLVPPDVLLIPMVVAQRKKWLRTAAICTLGSVTGALLGYLIGWAFYESVGKKVVDAYNLHHSMQLIGEKYAQNAFLTVLTAAFTPIPFKVITIAAGLFNIHLGTLVIASILGRGGRFFLVAGMLRIFAERVSSFIEKYFDILSIAFMVLLIGGFVLIKYVR